MHFQWNCEYIEMTNVEELDTEARRFPADISVKDNLQSNMIEIGLVNSPYAIALSHIGERAEKVFIASNEKSLNIMTIIKGFDAELNLYKSFSMMRSILTFIGDKDNGYTIKVSLIPFAKYNLPLNDELMKYFIQSFNEPYKSMEQIIFN